MPIQVSQVIIHEKDLKKLLKKANLSIAGLAREAGITRWTIHSALNGKSIMEPETWQKIKKVLDEKMKELSDSKKIILPR